MTEKMLLTCVMTMGLTGAIRAGSKFSRLRTLERQAMIDEEGRLSTAQKGKGGSMRRRRRSSGG